MSAQPSYVERVRPLRRAEYDRMVEAGLLAGEKVELLSSEVPSFA